MGKVSESIFTTKNVTIPMADVQHFEKHYHSCDLVDGTKKGDFSGIMVITKHTTWDMVADTWANAIWLGKPEAETFIQAWCFYRYELENETLKSAPEESEDAQKQQPTAQGVSGKEQSDSR